MKAFVTALAALCLPPAAHAQEPVVINDTALFPEGPVMSGTDLLYVEYAGQTVDLWDGKTSRQVWKQDGCGPSAIIPYGENYAITCYDSGQLVIISPDWQTVSTYDQDDAGNPMQGPNDGTPDGNGGIWFTLSGPWESGPIVGHVMHLTADGKLGDAANDLHYANGIALGPDGRLYVNESEAGRVISFAVAPDAMLSDRRLFIRLYQMGEAPDAFPDGIKLGPNGNFYIGEYSSGTIIEVSPDGQLQNRYTVPSAAAPNMAFAPDGKTMYVMAVDNKDGAPYQGKVYAMPIK